MPKISAVKRVDMGGGTEKGDFDIPTKISTSFFCLKGVSGMGGEGTLRRVES